MQNRHNFGNRFALSVSFFSYCYCYFSLAGKTMFETTTANVIRMLYVQYRIHQNTKTIITKNTQIKL